MAYNSFRKGEVEDPRDYKYGAINHYLDTKYKGKLPITIADVFLALGKTFKQQVKAFLKYEKAYLERLMGTV